MGLFSWIKGNRAKADQFARTVVQLDGPRRPKASRAGPLPHEPGDDAHAQPAMKIRFAQSDSAYEGATLLVQKRYEWRGYPKAQVYGTPNRVTILTHLDNRVVGTVTVGYDSEQGLLADEIYKDKIDTLRSEGRVVGELSKLAIDEEHGSKQVLAGMMHIAFIYGAIHGCTDAVIEVVPHHQAFYEKKLGFSMLGEERLNNRVNKTVVLLHIRMEEMQRHIDALGGQGKSSTDKSLYPYFFSPEEQRAIVERLMNE
ncbi:MAG: hypothetical protein AB1831_11835 [Pseudomonadota bacterium]